MGGGEKKPRYGKRFNDRRGGKGTFISDDEEDHILGGRAVSKKESTSQGEGRRFWQGERKGRRREHFLTKGRKTSTVNEQRKISAHHQSPDVRQDTIGRGGRGKSTTIIARRENRWKNRGPEL